jgi:hypothetical protein
MRKEVRLELVMCLTWNRGSRRARDEAICDCHKSVGWVVPGSGGRLCSSKVEWGQSVAYVHDREG